MLGVAFLGRVRGSINMCIVIAVAANVCSLSPIIIRMGEACLVQCEGRHFVWGDGESHMCVVIVVAAYGCPVAPTNISSTGTRLVLQHWLLFGMRGVAFVHCHSRCSNRCSVALITIRVVGACYVCHRLRSFYYSVCPPF